MTIKKCLLLALYWCITLFKKNGKFRVHIPCCLADVGQLQIHESVDFKPFILHLLTNSLVKTLLNNTDQFLNIN